mgnify:CR=1 FL=1
MKYAIFIYRNDVEKSIIVEFDSLQAAQKQWVTYVGQWSNTPYAVFEDLEWSAELVRLDVDLDVTVELADWSYWNHPDAPEVGDE